MVPWVGGGCKYRSASDLRKAQKNLLYSSIGKRGWLDAGVRRDAVRSPGCAIAVIGGEVRPAGQPKISAPSRRMSLIKRVANV